MTNREITKLLDLVSQNIKSIKNNSIKEVCKISNIDIDKWEWPQGVGIYGLYKRYVYTGDTKIRDWIENWIYNNIQNGLPERNINTTAPMLTVAFFAEETQREELLDLCRDWAEWIMTSLPRTKYGGFQHMVTDDYNDMQLWDDTLFMTVLFLAKAGKMFGIKKYLDECEHQFLLHSQYLMDTSTGLWYHGWTFDGNHNFADALWGRGNCWITAFVPEFMEITENNTNIKDFMTNILDAQAESLKKYQSNSGLWHTLINKPDSYLEVSASAGFVYGILKAVRMGLLSKEYTSVALKGAKAVIDSIDEDGTVNNVSYGTGMGKSLNDYMEIPICPMAYGNALVIMMLQELIQYMENSQEDFCNDI